MSRHLALLCGLAPLCVLVFAGCVTTGPDSAELEDDLLALQTLDLRPVTFSSRLHMDTGRYPNLFSPASSAVWVSEAVAGLKREKDEEAGFEVAPDLARDAAFIAQEYLVFEVHLESAFPDASIAYDVVGLRNMDMYLESPGGRRVRPLQRILGDHADEGQLGTLKRFSRSNILVFPKHDVIVRAPVIESDATSLRLVVDGFNSRFFFTWQLAPPEMTEAEREAMLQAEADRAEATRSGFSEFYSKLRALARLLQ